MFTSHAIKGVISSLIHGIIPGIGGLYGSGEFEKIKKARRLMIILNWLFVVSFGISILLFNKSFIQLWVGEEHFAGFLENLLILFIAIQGIFFQLDSLIINITLNMKMKVALSLAASFITILCALFFVEEFLIVGLCISILLGRMILTIGYPKILKSKLTDSSSLISSRLNQPFLISLLLLVLASYIGKGINIENWYFLFLALGMSFLASGLLFWFVGFHKSDREALWDVLSKLKFFKTK